jgi:hypothetical protein
MRPERDDDAEVGKALRDGIDDGDDWSVDVVRGHRDRHRTTTRAETRAAVLAVAVGGRTVSVRAALAVRHVAGMANGLLRAADCPMRVLWAQVETPRIDQGGL